VGEARVGVDLVYVPSFEARFAGRDDALAGLFTPEELAYCRRQPRPWNHLAARFAAKEAVLKALGTGLTGAMQWHDIEVTRDPAGMPHLAISGHVGAALHDRRLAPGSVSLSHAAGVAVAVVILSST
jgi:holo-[acyl-carrier protein] synthase